MSTPLSSVIFAALRASRPERLALTPRSLADVEAAVRTAWARSAEERRAALDEVVTVIGFLAGRGAQQAAAVLAALVFRVTHVELAVASRDPRREKLLAADHAPHAPRIDAARPAGTMRLGDLAARHRHEALRGARRRARPPR